MARSRSRPVAALAAAAIALPALGAAALVAAAPAPLSAAEDASYPADISAWGRMQARYPSWSPETRDSIYHHRCALDLF